MLYTNIYKQSPQKISKTSRISYKERLIKKFNNQITFNFILKQKHGKKIMFNENKQSKIKNKFNYKTVYQRHRSSASQQNNKNFISDGTFYQENRHKNIKRHTFNSQPYPLQEYNQHQYNFEILKTTQKKRFNFLQTANTQQTIKRKNNQKYVWNKKNSYLKDWNFVDKSETKKEINSKEIKYHHKFGSINFQKTKTPFVDLIRKFQFQNLKTAHLASQDSKNSQQDEKNYSQCFMKTAKDNKDRVYFNAQNKNKSKDEKDKICQTVNKCFKRYLQEQIYLKNKNIQKKTNTIYSPWVTQTQIINFHVNQ